MSDGGPHGEFQKVVGNLEHGHYITTDSLVGKKRIVDAVRELLHTGFSNFRVSLCNFFNTSEG